MNPLKQYIKERLERLEKENDFFKSEHRILSTRLKNCESDLCCAFQILDHVDLKLSYDSDRDHCVISIGGPMIPTEIHLGRMDPETVRELQNFITRLNARKGR